MSLLQLALLGALIGLPLGYALQRTNLCFNSAYREVVLHRRTVLLRLITQQKGGELLLIGIDLQKDIDVLERAYNDSAGITAAFNLNVLRHLNTEFGSDFDLDSYRHLAVYNQEEGRIEMYLVSLSDQDVSVGGQTFSIEAGERILTEHSHKYTIDGFADIASKAGFRLEKCWSDDDRMFAVCYLSRQ